MKNYKTITAEKKYTKTIAIHLTCMHNANCVSVRLESRILEIDKKGKHKNDFLNTYKQYKTYVKQKFISGRGDRIEKINTNN